MHNMNAPGSVEKAMDRVDTMMNNGYVDKDGAIKKLQEDGWTQSDAFLIVTAARGRRNSQARRKENG